MRKSIYYLITATLLCSTGCEKETLQTYNPESEGSSIYFMEPMTQKKDITREISFGYSGFSVKDSIISIPLGISGLPASVDRKFEVVATTASSMELNKHYEFVDDELVVRANHVTDTLKIRLLRSADMAESKFFLGIKLVANANFNVDIPFTYTTSSKAVSTLEYGIFCDDIAGVPFLWTATTNPTNLKTYTGYYLGTYSKRKVELMLDQLKIDPMLMYNPPATGQFNLDYLIIWSSYMKYWLGKEKSEGRIYYDENGKEIAMGQYAS